MATQATWEDCMGAATWIREPLQRTLSYPQPLPVQQAVIPTIARALLSDVPNDVSLTAPTGSGKTLCYLIPLVRLLTEAKIGVDDNALRCLVLVPTQALGQQVHRELQRLTRSSSIRAACLCAETTTSTSATGASAEAAEVAEARELVRRVVLPRCLTSATSDDDDDDDDDDGVWSGVGCGGDDEGKTGLGSSGRSYSSERVVRYFSNVDVIVATPQRLLHHLDYTRGLSLATLRLLVIDEADQVLVGTFAAQVQKVNARYELETRRLHQRQLRRQARTRARLARAASGTTTTVPPLLSPWLRSVSGSATMDTAVLHKMLCSATLSSRIARISQLRLRNCSYYVLDSNGAERPEDGAAAAGPPSQSAPAGPLVRTQFALPPTLQEHVLFVEDTYRPAVLLKLIHTLRTRIAATVAATAAAAARKRADAAALRWGGDADRDDDDDDDAGRRRKDVSADQSAAGASPSYPNVEDRAGTGILVFCATAEEARVMSHFLAAAGVSSVVEFTTLATEAERRRALLDRCTDDADADVSCVVVASDALMRGIDIPNVGHVIMYHPPEAVSQYVHRAGRTARAMRPGHVHLLLSKTGPGGTQEDGEVALYKRLAQSLSRTMPVSYERGFFRFAAAPSSRGGDDATSAVVESDAPAAVVGSAEWWVAQAGHFLVQSQHQLQRRWASALESAAATAAAAAAAAPATAAHTAPPTPAPTVAALTVADTGKSTASSRKRDRSSAPHGTAAEASTVKSSSPAHRRV
ncbi:ATP-dependent RNA helicase [Novymonas esmeraldas]|uniref:ATP-dependent RNA helicase n=1 Tax=Novymonas esmeraldas TaxID=1808958 RepID=A0AAW0EQY6_9TRYP